MPHDRETFYDRLGVRVGSSAEVIRRAWKLAAWDNHPDLRSQVMSAEERRQREERMQKINEAYQVLSDPGRRRRYDLENGLIPATCGQCGKPGSQRLASHGGAVPVCDTCWGRHRNIIAL
jgi:DnaJ-class molecular chaperone